MTDERMAQLCADAVDPLEIAAGLEAHGVNDEAAQRHGHPDVFAFAAAMFASTDRHPSQPEAQPNPWRGQVWRHLLRGVLFGLPALCSATLTPVLNRPTAVVVLILSLLLSWAASQGVAYLAYVRLGQGDRAAAARVMRHGLVTAALVIIPVTAVAGVLLGAGTLATVVAAGQCVYMLAATAALVSGAEPWLLLALAPGAVWGAVTLLVTPHGHSVAPGVWFAWATTLVATVALAVVSTTRQGPATGPVVTGREVRESLPYAAFGLLAGGLLTFTLLAAFAGWSAPSQATPAAVFALSLSMGVAEWVLYAYRRQIYRVLRRSPDLRAFAVAARRALTKSIVSFLIALAALTATAAVLAHVTGSAPALRILGGYLGLGGALFVALLLQSCGRVGAALLACAYALTGEVIAMMIAPSLGADTVQLAAACGLLAALFTYAFVVLSRATSHR